MKDSTKNKVNKCLSKMDKLKKFGLSKEWTKAIEQCKHIVINQFKDQKDTDQ